MDTGPPFESALVTKHSFRKAPRVESIKENKRNFEGGWSEDELKSESIWRIQYTSGFN